MFHTFRPRIVFLFLSLAAIAAPHSAAADVAEMKTWLQAAGRETAGLEAWDALQPSAGRAYRQPGAVYIALDGKQGNQLTIARLYNRLVGTSWLGDDAHRPLKLAQTQTTWKIDASGTPPEGARRVVVVDLVGPPRLAEGDGPPLARPAEDGSLTLGAHLADVHGAKLQYEPLPFKNTLGYWVNGADWAEWRFELPAAGRYEVRILQGCGGSGGSPVELQFGGEKIRFEVEPTGHYQNFRWRSVGSVELPAGQQRLEVRPQKKVGNAVMDLRAVRLVPAAAPRLPVARPPNVVVFLADDLGTLDAGCYGSRDLFTPHIDGLAAAGVRFTQAYAHTVCCPARALLLTGRHPQRSGVNAWTQGNARGPVGRNMELAEETLAEVLQKAGYQTALCGKWHLGAAPSHGPTRQGFDAFLGLRGGFIDNYNHHFLHGNGFHDLYRGTEEISRPGVYFPDMMTDEALRFIEANRARAFFLYVAFNIPHYPEQADRTFDQKYLRTPMPRQSYAKMVSATDARIGRVLEKLDELRLRDNTVVLFTSDNGHSAEEYKIGVDEHASGLPKGHDYGAHGGGGNTGKWRGHKGTFYEGGLRVPAILSSPGELPEGEVRDQAVIAADWYPTIVQLCGLQPSKIKLDGASLLPMILDDGPSHHNVLHWQWQKGWAVREGDWKLIGGGRNEQLVNLADKRPEGTNHLAEQPEVAERLRGLHETWAREVTPAKR